MDRRQFFGSSIAVAVAASLPYRRLLAADIEAVTGRGTATTLARDDLQALRDSLRGPLLLPGNTAYDDARRVVNEAIDRHPALVVQASGAADVRTAVRFARAHDLLLAVKCGGHAHGGQATCDGGLQLDLSRFHGVRIDTSSQTAYVAGGSLLGELDHEAMACGLVTTAGTVSRTGVGGLTLGGGFGRLARRFGLALDNVKAVDLVTADGQLVHASVHENPDLFWGVRGGGGNFGVVTEFQFALHPMQRQVIAGNVVFPIARARELLGFYRDFSLHAPDELYTDCVISAVPGKDGVFVIQAVYSGTATQADTVLAPLHKLGTPIANTIRSKDYVDVQRAGDRTDPRTENAYGRSGFVDGFKAGLEAAIMDGFEPRPDRQTLLFFQHAGGAIGRVAPDATAFPHRRGTHNMLLRISWPLEQAGTQHARYGEDYWRSLQRFTDGWYTNEVSDESPDIVEGNYQANLKRLQALKNKHDPGNLFRLNANVRPTV